MWQKEDNLVFYFSGTGNSQFVAMQIADAVGEQPISINTYLKEGKKAAFTSQSPLVFVAPTYAWRLPKVVEQWIEATEFGDNRNAYFVLTCGDDCGNAEAYARRLCIQKGLQFCGLTKVVMPENYVAMFDVPSKAGIKSIIDKSQPIIKELAQNILDGKPFAKRRITVLSRILSSPVNIFFNRLLIGDKGFRVSDACISCNKCAQRCPLNNIDMASGKPVWQGSCTHCMACIGGCPTQAIEYKSRLGFSSYGKARYYIKKD